MARQASFFCGTAPTMKGDAVASPYRYPHLFLARLSPTPGEVSMLARRRRR
ncbi:hypothetical protein INS88_03320 [Trueperella pecoris]|uniref:Uncharacterized protein n=1 Tax=Trueperella pecoris TaxID=2733571 RepID=A0A7M1QWK3_9ACTO|nr:hypothetical protein [Trueperella pecoris]QOR46246.1 hypothetical protein INS88_03320 [Trueperella pecoris]QTG76071.1 hypothetical protein J4179_03235 [Trueperella pecoris]